MFFIPVRTDSPVRRPPHVNRLLLAANILVWIWTDVLVSGHGTTAAMLAKARWMIDPNHLELSQFFTYQFIHGDLWHLVGNMLFLWVFGNSVNSKMGDIAYLFFYLASGVFAGLGFAFTSVHPCMGASGAIAGVTTAYLVLFPCSEVTVFYWLLFYVGTMRVGAMLLITLKIILWDNIIAPTLTPAEGYTQIAYAAHLAGYAFGFLLAAFMLLVRALPRDQYDIIALFKRYRQREQFKAVMANPNAQAKAIYGRVARPISAITGIPVEEPPADSEVTRLRGEIGDLLAGHQYPAASEKFEALIARDPHQCLPQRSMLAVANQFMIDKKYAQAAFAYERFLKHYPTDNESQQVKLVLGILYAKYLAQHESAEKYLRECLARLTNPDQLQQAQHWLSEVTVAMRNGPSVA